MREQKPVISKPFKVVLVLVILLLVSLFGSTLGIYAKEAPVSQNLIGAKLYAFEISNDVDAQSVEPGGSVTYTFSVRNFNTNGTAEIPLQTYVTIYFPTDLASTGRVLAQLYYGSQLLGSSDTGTLYCAGITLPENVKTTDVYSLTLSWLDADMTLLGDSKWQTFTPSQVHISVAGYQ